MLVTERNLLGLKVVTKDEFGLGEVVGIKIQTSGWAVKAIEVSLKADILKKLNMRRPAFGSRTVEISVGAIDRVDSSVVLSSTVAELTKDSDDSIPSPYRVEE